MMEATYKTKDVTNKTGIPKHIVRKYSQLLEEHGYMISKTADARIYKLDDLKLLKSIHEKLLHYKKIFQKRYRLF